MKGKIVKIGKRMLTLALAAAMLLSGFAVTDMYYGINQTYVYAAGLAGTNAEVSQPAYNSANMPAMDTTGTVAYWYAGNKFLALNQFNGGADATQASKSITIGDTTMDNGSMKFYNDENGYHGIETTDSNSERSDKKSLQTTYTVTSTVINKDQQTYVQSQNDSFFENGTVWELMDSDAVWDDDYLFAQYKTMEFGYQTTTYAPSILNTVENWYDNGFSYPAGGGGTAVSAQGDYFSESEKNNVKSATITTDGVSGSIHTTSNDTITAHLFAPSVDEIYYNPQQVRSIYESFAGSNAGRTTSPTWQLPRCCLWLRSIWGFESGAFYSNYGIVVRSSGTLDNGHVAREFAVAPAFYLDTKGVVMAKDATYAAAEAAASASATLEQYSADAADENNSVKFLLSDSTLAPDFTTTVSQKRLSVEESGGTYSINYSGAATSTDQNTDAGNQNDYALVISAIVYDENGKILYYGVLGDVTAESGSVNLTIPAIAEDKNYILAIFEEQLGGTSIYRTSDGISYKSYETDYQSGGVSYTLLNTEQEENATGFDANTWYSYDDKASGIEWMYKLNANGDVIGLYTESLYISGIIDSGKCLNVPAKINGRTVIGIGGEREDHPFIPASQKAWTSISFPSTLTTINDYAFIGSTAHAKIVIPSSVNAIGVKAFYGTNITQVILSEFDGTVGSYAFASTDNLSTVTIKGGAKGLTLSTVCFADSSITDLSITGNVTVNKKAFRNDTSLKTINLSGNIRLNEFAFDGCNGADTLSLSGTVNIGSYAFNDCTAFKDIYLPVGTVINEYSFNGCSGIEFLEADCNLPAHSFEGTGNITCIILDQNCLEMAYDWEGNHTLFEGAKTSTTDSNGVSSLSAPGRTVYARNAATLYRFYGEGGSYLSCFGAAGTVQVFIPYDNNFNTDGSTKEATDNVLTLYGITLENYDTYDSYKNAGDETFVYVTSVNNIDTEMSIKGITALAESASVKLQTGINAYYSGTILTTKDIDKSKMTVTRVFGAEEGETYTPVEFYVVRTSEFNAEMAGASGVLEENIAAYEPVSATDDDLSSGQNTGTISATVVVFYIDMEGETAVKKYFSTPVSIRVEEYTAKSYIEQMYGSYDAVAAAFVEYEERIKSLENALASADVDSIDILTKELAECKAQYAELVEELAKYVADNKADQTGYFGTTVDGSGNKKDVVFIEGNAIEYEGTGKKDSDGNTIYKGRYDADGNGEPEEIYFVVKGDGIHLTDAAGNPVKADGSAASDGEEGEVYSDKLGALQRQLTAQINNMKSQLDACDEGIAKIKQSITDTGYTYDELTGDNDYDKISGAIRDLSGKVSGLEADNDTLNKALSEAQGKITSYNNALNAIYNKLAGEDLSAEDAASLTYALTAINSKIEKLQSDLSVAKATITDLRTKLSDAESEVSSLTTELENTDHSLAEIYEKLSKAEDNLASAKSEKEELMAQYEAAIAAGNEESAKALKEQIDAKKADIAELETTRTELNNTKDILNQKQADLEEARQMVVNLQAQIKEKEEQIARLKTEVEALSSTADGYKVTVSVANSMFSANLSDDATAEDISNAVNAYVKEKISTDATIKAIQELLNTSATGNELVTEVSNAISDGTGSDGTIDYTGYTKDTEVNTASKSYASGYSAGYTEGVKASAGNSNTSDTNTAYNNGYNAGKNSVNTTSYYNDGYNKGYSAGVSSIDTSSSSTTYKNGYSAGYSDGQKSGQTVSTSPALTGGTGNGTSNMNKTNSNNGNTSQTDNSNDDTENKPAEDVENEDGIVIEGSTADMKENIPVSSGVSMGTVVTISIPASSGFDPAQKANVILNYIPEEKEISVSTNADSYMASSVQQQNNAYKIIEYYKNNLTELGKLGSDEIKEAAADSSKSLTFDILSSVDVIPSDTQREAIENGDKAEISLTSAEFTSDAIYLVIHESDVRTGEFDIMLSEAVNNKLTMSLPDLSPITVIKVKVETIQNLDEKAEQDSGVIDRDITEMPETFNKTEDNHPYAIVAYILIVIAFGVLAVLFFLIKKRSGSK